MNDWQTARQKQDQEYNASIYYLERNGLKFKTWQEPE